MGLFLELLPGEGVRIGDSTVKVEDKSGRKIRLRIESSEEIEHVKDAAALRRGPRTTASPAAPGPSLQRPTLKLAT